MVSTVLSPACPLGRAGASIEGAGIGLRLEHLEQVLREKPDVPWFELLLDNHLVNGGVIPLLTEAVSKTYPLTFHCVGMSLAGIDPLNFDYLTKIREAADRYDPVWVSDHLCFSQRKGSHFHDLLPFPYTEESLDHVVQRVLQIQDYLNRPLVVENVSTYLKFSTSQLSESEFLSALVERTDCRLLLDVNNVYVNAVNHRVDAHEAIFQLPLENVVEIHLAGYDDQGDFLLDAHNNQVSGAVWDLYRWVLDKTGPVPTLIEWDNDLPRFEVLQGESAIAQTMLDQQEEQGSAVL